MEVIKREKSRLQIIQYGAIYVRLEVCPEDSRYRWKCSNCVAFSYRADITTGLDVKTVTSSTLQIHDPYHTVVSATKLYILPCWNMPEVPVKSSHRFSLCRTRQPRDYIKRSLRSHRTQIKSEIWS